MFQAFIHLVLEIAVRTTTFLGTTLPGLAAQIVVLFVSEARDGWGFTAWKKNWTLKRTIYALLCVWVPTFCVYSIKTVYQDHVSLVRKVSDLSAEIKIIGTKSNQCWVKNYVEPKDPNAPTNVVPVSRGVVVCNREFAVPYSLIFEYDQKLERTGPIVFPVGGMTSLKEWGPIDNKLMAVLDAPAIRPNEPFIVFAIGTTNRPPMIVRLTIKTASTADQFVP